MGGQGFHIAQLNVARARAPLEDPRMARFVSQLEEMYAEAERSPGFVWRLRPEDVPPRARAAADPRLFITLSVWETIEALHSYVYRSAHSAPLRERGEWFEQPGGPNLVLWWVERGRLPGVEQGLARLKRLALKGPTPLAFTFRHRFPPPHAGDPAARASD